MSRSTSAHADWITREELAELTGWDRATIYRKQKSREIKTRESARSRNGKNIREYDASSLPAELQAKRLRQKMSSAPLVLAKRSEQPVAALSSPDSSSTIRTLAALSTEGRKQAEQRLSVIAPLIDFTNNANNSTPILALGADIQSVGEIVKHLAAKLPYSERTIWRWWNLYKTFGPGALAGKTRADKNTSRFFSNHKEAAEFASNKFLNERLSIAMVHEALLREWKRLQPSPGALAPSYETTRLFLNGLSPIITAIARQGEKAYNNDFAPFLLRNIEARRVNEYWISDHMAHDVFVRNIDLETGKPVFNELPLNASFRPWLTCIVDMRSRRVVGQVWCATPSSNTISSALRFALRHYGMPAVFYIDNGKDYKKLGQKGEHHLSDDAQGVLVRLGIRSQHCLPKHPQSKQIESFFRTVHQRFDRMWGDAYCGTSPATRPEACDALRVAHKKLVASGDADSSPLPAASEFIQAAATWIDWFNSSFSCSGHGMKGKSPQQIYDAELPPQRRKPVNLADVAQLFWDRQKRVVFEGGCVQLFNAQYEPSDPVSRAELMLRIKREVLIACDPLNVGEAIALTTDGHFLGNLRAQELLIHGETSAEEIRSSLRARRKVLSATKHYLATLQRHRTQAGDASELEVLQHRAIRKVAGAAIHTLPAPRVVNAQITERMHVDDIVASLSEE